MNSWMRRKTHSLSHHQTFRTECLVYRSSDLMILIIRIQFVIHDFERCLRNLGRIRFDFLLKVGFVFYVVSEMLQNISQRDKYFEKRVGFGKQLMCGRIDLLNSKTFLFIPSLKSSLGSFKNDRND